MMRVLVLGAGGYIGRRVAAALAQSGWAHAVTRARDSLDSLEQSLRQVDAVANCLTGRAQEVSSGATALFSAASRSGRSLPIVHLSSMTVYGSRVGIVDEQGPAPGDLGPYSAAQRDADQLASTYPEAIRLRPGCEYGPDCIAWTGRVARWLLQRRLGDLGAAGDGFCNLLFIDDLVAAMLAALQRPSLRGKAYNLALPSQLTWNEYFVRFAQELGAVPVRRITRRRLALETRILAPPLKLVESLAGKAGLSTRCIPPPIPPSLLRTASQEIRLDVSRAETELGIAWTSLERGLHAAATWLRVPAS